MGDPRTMTANTTPPPPMSPSLTPDLAANLAQRFGLAIVDAHYVLAHALLSLDAKRAWPLEALRNAVTQMIGKSDSALTTAEVLSEFTVTDWPTKAPEDLAVLYVSLRGEGVNEAVTVTVCDTALGLRIRELQWGRP